MKEKKLEGLSPFDRFQALAKALVNVPKAEVEKKAKEQLKRQQPSKPRTRQ